MIFLFNTNIVPDEAVVRVKKITAHEAREIIYGQITTSAIGHSATAEAMSVILEAHVPVNRIFAQPKAGDTAISLKLNGRLEEGKILNAEDMGKVGYTLYLMSFFPVECEIS